MCDRTPGAGSLCRLMLVSGFRGHKKHHQQTQAGCDLLAEIQFRNNHLIMLPNYH